MLSKSIPERSAPHHGIGRCSKCFRAFSRRLRIQSGSDLRAEISSTTASDSPRLGSKTEFDSSFQSNRYPLLSSRRCSSWLTATPCSPFVPVGGGRSGRAPHRSRSKVYSWGRIRDPPPSAAGHVHRYGPFDGLPAARPEAPGRGRGRRRARAVRGVRAGGG